ncbi:MAG: exo-alpha-sialidase [Clostridia bacterium]|nr:exo-alpha-sialidase [Clostridia bacterium]
MLITEKEALKTYGTTKRLWQGIPSIEVTKKGRIFITFYSGETREEIGNFSLLILSDDGGKTFTEPVAVAYDEGHRCFDPCIWLDPLGRLWFTWARYPDDGVYAVICEDPDADELHFTEPFLVGRDVMMNKPTVLSTGEWLFPIAVWKDFLCKNYPGYSADIKEKGSYVYATDDEGKTFRRRGCSDVKERSADEHMILEMQDGSLRMFVRTEYGIGASDSFDGGKTWSADYDSGYGGPCSRFHIRRLTSGRILLINHYDFQRRNNLTAMLSEDDGKTFPYRLLLDERNDVSYPDAKEAEDGFIYITYDRDRGAFKWKMRDIFASEREILMAKITEEDILAGTIMNENSFLKRIVNKLSGYDGHIRTPFHEAELCD